MHSNEVNKTAKIAWQRINTVAEYSQKLFLINLFMFGWLRKKAEDCLKKITLETELNNK
jgi:hypothetical protein